MKIIKFSSGEVFLKCGYCNYMEIYHTDNYNNVVDYLNEFPFPICKKNNGKPHKLEVINKPDKKGD